MTKDEFLKRLCRLMHVDPVGIVSASVMPDGTVRFGRLTVEGVKYEWTRF